MEKLYCVCVYFFIINCIFSDTCRGDEKYDLLFRGIACEDRSVEYKCPQSYKISIVEASYGRTDNVTCSLNVPLNKTTDGFCDVSGVEQTVRNICDSKQSCIYRANSETFTENTTDCQDIYKYANVLYKCEVMTYNVQGCEGDKVQISCPADEVIHINNVTFGRLDNNETCQHESIQNTSCSARDPGYQVLSSLCNGRRSCQFYAFSSIFGDPCPGTYKTLGVDYVCGACVNKYNTPDCDKYDQLWGECDHNFNWMSANCRQTCWQCQYTDKCRNFHGDNENCDFWAQTGECFINPVWMNEKCRSSCNACKSMFEGRPDKITSSVNFCESGMVNVTCEEGFSLRIDDMQFGRWSLDTCQHSTVNESTPICATPADALSKTKEVCDARTQCLLEARIDMYGDLCPGIHKQAKVIYTCQECRNVLWDSECEIRKNAGKCASDSTWMMDYCFKTCSGCDVRECGNLYDEQSGDTPICDYWAVKGECTKSVDYTSKNCRTSCNKCQQQMSNTSTTVSTITTTTTPVTTVVPTDSPIFKETCEGKTIEVKCPEESYLRIDNMFFGRLDNISCPHESINTTNCTTPEGSILKVRGVCNGRNSCHFPANHRAWGDPCPGTYKAASILYTCTACINTASDIKCQNWAAKGKCASDYHNMIQQCYKTCSKCESKGCGNNHQSSSDCDYWALRGECEHFPGFMIDNCKESCQSCNSTPSVLPLVQNSICERQSIELQCPQNYHVHVRSMFYGRVNNNTCKHDNIFTTNCTTPDGALNKLEGLCNGRGSCYFEARSELWGDKCRPTYKVANVSYTCHLCRNMAIDVRCQQWASEGKCSSEPDMMMEQCYLTCSGCLDKGCGNQHTSSLDCDYWSLLSECQYNPAFMLSKCRESCHFCSTPATTPSPLSTTTSVPHPDKTPDKKVTLCEKQVKQLECSGLYYLRINSIFYGRKDKTTCPHATANNTNCPSVAGIVDKARRVCNGRHYCWFEALSRVWGDNCPDTYKVGIAEYNCQLCRNIDLDSQCEQLKTEGKCTTDYNSMMDNCFKTCTQCHKGCSNSYNISIDCDYWALIGECSRNSKFMLKNCESSCKSCPVAPPMVVYNCSGVDGCNNHGKCVGADVCSCDYGWEGSTCNTFNCADDSNCSNNGWCVGPNKCLCDTYYGGRDCSTCTVTFQPGSACLPCPRCQHGSCMASPQETSLSNHSYIGCFKDRSESRDLPNLLTGVVVTKSIDCVSQCHMKGYLYAGIQNVDKCYCGNRYGQHGNTDKCNSICNTPGDKCGGLMANNVWRTYQGTCQCEQGWSGLLCSDTQTSVTLAIKLQIEWKDIYRNVTTPETLKLYNTISSNLLQFYKSFDTNVIAVKVNKLRQGSVIVDHEVTLNGQQDAIAQETFQCAVFDNIKYKGQLGPDMPAQPDTNLEQKCSWRANYCKNGGHLIWASSKWKCSCPENYKGDFCEVTGTDNTILIAVIVAAIAVFIVIFIIIICVCARRSSKTSRSSTTASTTDEAYTMHVTDTDSLANLKDQAELSFCNDGYS